MEKKKDKRLGKRCSIHIESIRHRLTDTDGVSGKAAIDGLVLCGILRGDRAKDVAQVTYSQRKVGAKVAPETTVITIK